MLSAGNTRVSTSSEKSFLFSARSSGTNGLSSTDKPSSISNFEGLLRVSLIFFVSEFSDIESTLNDAEAVGI